jgi:hypothetical protein
VSVMFNMYCVKDQEYSKKKKYRAKIDEDNKKEKNLRYGN